MKLVTDNLTFKPEKEYFLNKVSLEFEAGKLYTLLGRTLSGKTSLLKTIAGLQPIDTGNIFFFFRLEEKCGHGVSTIY